MMGPGGMMMPGMVPGMMGGMRPMGMMGGGPGMLNPALANPGMFAAKPVKKLNAFLLRAKNLPAGLPEESAKSLFEPFGPLKMFKLEPTKEGALTLEALFEYEDSSVIDKCISGLTGIDLGGVTLVVVREHPNAAMGVGADEGPGDETPVIMLGNMVEPDELKDDEMYEEIYEDVKDECGKHGAVKGLQIPRPHPNGDQVVPGLGKIFVSFEEIDGANKALQHLRGRKFGGNEVSVRYYDPALFLKKDFSCTTLYKAPKDAPSKKPAVSLSNNLYSKEVRNMGVRARMFACVCVCAFRPDKSASFSVPLFLYHVFDTLPSIVSNTTYRCVLNGCGLNVFIACLLVIALHRLGSSRSPPVLASRQERGEGAARRRRRRLGWHR